MSAKLKSPYFQNLPHGFKETVPRNIIYYFWVSDIKQYFLSDRLKFSSGLLYRSCMRILLITIFEYSLVWGILYPLLITISKYSFGHEKTTIFMFIQYMSDIQYVLSGSLVVLMWDLETSKNFKNWFYSFDKWGWLCVIQYPVWWLILRYCYTYDIYKISLTENHWLLFLSVDLEYVNFSRYFRQFCLKASMPQHEQSLSVLNHKNHIVWL